MTANDKLKTSWNPKFWGSMIFAIVLHFLVFAFWPTMSAEDFSGNSDEFEMVYIPPEVEIPPPPDQIQRPATPQIAEVSISEDITIASTTFDDNPVDQLPPPPDAPTTSQSTGPVFVPRDVDPVFTNRTEVSRELQKSYPPLLRDSGIEGETQLWLFVNASGEVEQSQIYESSGYTAMDRVAQEVALKMEFRPALNRDKTVGVWVVIPITFTIN